ncbi:YihA family ribosome biogenesis GTP-binding protein [Prosthecochloris sp. N3]|uniref:Probable GTP-binding protein EngB n=1 Tax=Prosthecochloris ethylica TaxID=2743976 RepID=A0ABR9XNY9_9CHLB|nr:MULTISPECIES: ribosome biogenesis GTP-binding protein YihA/YsxC [Prosthecochloris]MBF0585835.1 YihA family ribosome biogenesis GTP-binding protein [Prosthecochloris ethylica]MBF0635745.1 YihA family ribosome biogenesis GTP-binding protein [Prosthecochloris ethylica]NUK47043.1 YihA family ribosome biogenesis GTP-binding protein [Prosthecochloris ethylica]RNA65523.1 YihA family ribosome biogenesis GTP-binding protein [Prosthecochloris sp. ZM_2]
MKIHTATFHKSVSALQGLPESSMPEIVFVGRSNVGKSTLLNTLTGRKALARTSSTPGKTRLINYFLINDCCYFVDLPGYGYAKVAKGERREWGHLLGGYISTRQSISLVVVLIDSRHPALDADRQMMDFLDHYHRPYGIVLTKYDKLKQKDKVRARRELKSIVPKTRFIVNYSALSGEGTAELLENLEHYTG